jgi:purine-binding chemotaxis protein CheW
VREVVLTSQIVPIPHAPAFVEGIIRYRAHAIPVIDLAKCLGQFAIKHGPKTRIVVVRLPKTLAGLIVDSVEEVLEIASGPDGFIKSSGGALNASHIAGLVTIKDKTTLLLDLAALFCEEDLKLPEVKNDAGS